MAIPLRSLLLGAAACLVAMPALGEEPPPAAPPASSSASAQAPTIDPAEKARLADACDEASGMPAGVATASPDLGLLDAGSLVRDPAHVEAVVESCSRAAAADPSQGRFPHRLGLAFVELKRTRDAVDAFNRSMALGFAGGYDEVSSAKMSGALAPDLPKDVADGIAVARRGIAATNDPEIKRDLADTLLSADATPEAHAEGRKLLQEAAAQKHRPAIADLAARMVDGGGGFQVDAAGALAVLEPAVAAGSRSATFELALLYDNGIGAPSDRKRARALYARAGEEGFAQGMTSLADMMIAGDGGPKDVPAARTWLARAAGQGDSLGRHRLANSYLHNDPKQTAIGLTMMTRMAEDGDTSAAYALAEIFKDGIDVTRDPAAAMRWYRKAADAGEAKAYERMGSMLDYGQGVAVDHAEARRLYDRALAKGVPAAYQAIGMQYDHGYGRPVDVHEAFRWYEKGAAQGNAASMSNLGFAYENARGVRQDMKAAVKWYTKAAQLDDPTAEHNLANLYLDGKGVKADPLTGLALMRKSAAHGQAMAMNDLALMLMKPPQHDGPAAVQLLRQAAANNIPVAYLNLAQALADGWDGRSDFVEANYWYRRAVDNPSDLQAIVRSESQFHLGENMTLGRGIARDVAGGRALISAAAKAGNPTARAFLKGRTLPQSYRQ